VQTKLRPKFIRNFSKKIGDIGQTLAEFKHAGLHGIFEIPAEISRTVVSAQAEKRCKTI
jgi:hypothetical protein